MQADIPTTNWEYRLMVWAQEALASRPAEAVARKPDVLSAAYQYCEALTRLHSRTFFVASGLLPEGKRQAARALYAFCRVTDNLVDDNEDGNPQVALAAWAERLTQPNPPMYEPVAVAWADTQARYNIPAGYASQLIAGVARDITQKRYKTFADLAEYAYGVASTVGLMAMHIIGFSGDEAVPFAVKLGVALQITNVLRDVGEDWRAGRLYLPQDELAAFGITESDLALGRLTEEWREFMRFQIERNRALYEESRPGIAALNRDGRLAITAACDLYQAILDDIEVNAYDVFRRRARVSTLGKIRRLPSIWRRARTVKLPIHS